MGTRPPPQPPENPSILFILFISAGPCALDYSKMKTPDGRWSDPSADELVQRHRIHSGLSMKRRQLNLDKPQLSSTLPSVEEFLVAPSIAREHVESLHQNASANMLFGKNNVEVQPVSMKLCQGPVSVNAGLKFNLLRWILLYVCLFQTFKNKNFHGSTENL